MNQRLYVGNLAFHTSEATIRSAFSAFGAVSDVQVVTDRDTGRSRGFAFVTMTEAAQAGRAMSDLDGSILDGRPLRVNLAEARGRAGGRGGA